MNKQNNHQDAAARAASYVQDDKVHKALYSDPEIFEAELDKVFNNTWVWLAHESEISQKGSYKTANIGRQPVIVVRQRSGDVKVLLNRCRHRGATVCDCLLYTSPSPRDS